MTILLLEDDPMIGSGLVYALESEGYQVVHCTDVHTAHMELQKHEFSLAILDITLPDGSGYDVFSILQKRGPVPAIFVTALDSESSVVKGLEMGAEDYIVKPFRVRELLARVKTVLRRTGNEQSQTTDSKSRMHLGPIAIHTDTAKVYKADQELELTALEYRLLLIFATHKGQVLSRGQILELLWDAAGNYVNDNTLTVYIKRLREKLEQDPQNPQLIITLRGLGYRAEE